MILRHGAELQDCGYGRSPRGALTCRRTRFCCVLQQSLNPTALVGCRWRLDFEKQLIPYWRS
jgi:hypothetical protein